MQDYLVGGAGLLRPPLLAALGLRRKIRLGRSAGPTFRLLHAARRLRGGAFDPFGRTAERKTERRLVTEYEAVVSELMAGLTPQNHALAVEIARLPEQIRGFGHVKQGNLAKSKAREASLLDALRSPLRAASAAE